MAGTKFYEDWRPQHPPEHYESLFPNIEVKMVMVAFRSHHLTKGTLSMNWEATWLGFCEYRESQFRMAQKMNNQRGGRDSVGLSLDPAKRRVDPVPDFGIRFMEALEKYTDLPADEAHRRALKDLEESP